MPKSRAAVRFRGLLVRWEKQTANDEGSDARSKNWTIAAGKSPIPFHALVPHAVVLPEFGPVAGTIAQPTPRNHDPPRVRNLRSRAPPA